MKPVEISKNIWWVGAIDWNVRNFHGHTYKIKRGTTYNAYLIIDEKIALVDTVYGPFAGEMIERISKIIDPAKIDYVIANHVEIDHSGGIPDISKICPKAKFYGTQKCKEGLERMYYLGLDFQAVKTGDRLSLGKKTLQFIEAPMLHWPDSMFSYLVEDAILLPNDAFGQHYATDKRFDDEVDQVLLMDEAAKYYANILLPFSGLVLKKLEDIKKLNIPVKMIAPSHGIIWRKDPSKILNAYASWAAQETKHKAVLVYETMWGATEKMAAQISSGLIKSGIDARVFEVNQTDKTEIIKEMLDAKCFVFGSSTHDNGMLPNIAGFLELLKGLKPKNRITALFGSYGWAGGAVSSMEKVVKESGFEIVQQPMAIQYMPDKNDTEKCFNWGMDLAEKIKKRENVSLAAN